MKELANFINDEPPNDIDPLIKMAMIHHQFESIHPFPDGNGRIGRVLNVLYLTHKELLDSPILYLSRAINRTKPDYYRLLQAVREEGAWEEWVIYILRAVTETAKTTLQLVSGIRDLMAEHKNRIRSELPKIYSPDLLNKCKRTKLVEFSMSCQVKFPQNVLQLIDSDKILRISPFIDNYGLDDYQNIPILMELAKSEFTNNSVKISDFLNIKDRK